MSQKNPLFVFFGTPHLSTIVLDRLEARGFLPALVVTAPDKPQGRGLALASSPVKQWAQERNIDVVQPETLKDETFLNELKNTDWDLFVVAMYAKLIPKQVLDIPRRGCLNVHPSLLPKFRGPSPVISAILADERETGVSIMLLGEKMDDGPVLAQATVQLEENAWPPRGSMFEELLATEGGNLLADTIPFWLRGDVTPVPQVEDTEALRGDESRATYTKKFTDADALVDIEGDAHEALLKIRAFDKSPRAHFITAEGKRIIITEAEIADDTLKILRVIPEGKKEMAYEDFLRGQKHPLS